MGKQSDGEAARTQNERVSFWNSAKGFMTGLAGVLVATATVITAFKALWPAPAPSIAPLATVVIPSLRGSALGEAETALTKAGFKYSELPARITSTSLDPIPPKSVAVQEPAAGPLLPGTTVFLTPEADWIPVPDLQNQILADAKKALGTDFVIQALNQTDGKSVEENAGTWKIVQQSPPPNTVAKPSATMTLTCQLVTAAFRPPQMKILLRPKFVPLQSIQTQAMKRP